MMLTIYAYAQDGWKAWKKALKQSNQLDDDGYEDEAARLAAKMVEDAHKSFATKAAGKLKGKGKKSNGDPEEAEGEPFSLLHKVQNLSVFAQMSAFRWGEGQPLVGGS